MRTNSNNFSSIVVTNRRVAVAQYTNSFTGLYELLNVTVQCEVGCIIKMSTVRIYMKETKISLKENIPRRIYVIVNFISDLICAL